MNVMLDPYILAVPDDADIERVLTYLQTLSDWVHVGKHRFWLSWSVVDALHETGFYPTWEKLTRLESTFPVDKPVNINTAFRALERQICAPPLLDDLVPTDQFMFDKSQVVVIPDAVAGRLHSNIADALKETLALAALGRCLGADSVFDDLLFATVPNGFSEKNIQTEFEALLENASSSTEVVVEDWEMIFSPDELDDVDGLSSFWKDTDRALAWARRKVQAEGYSTDQMAKCIAGRRFHASIYKTHLNERPVVLNALFIKTVKMLCGIIPRFKKSRYNNKSTPNHPIKKGGEIVTRQDDGAKAYRLVIQGEWRLHYWLLEDGSIELANVECGHAMHIES